MFNLETVQQSTSTPKKWHPNYPPFDLDKPELYPLFSDNTVTFNQHDFSQLPENARFTDEICARIILENIPTSALRKNFHFDFVGDGKIRSGLPHTGPPAFSPFGLLYRFRNYAFYGTDVQLMANPSTRYQDIERPGSRSSKRVETLERKKTNEQRLQSTTPLQSPMGTKRSVDTTTATARGEPTIRRKRAKTVQAESIKAGDQGSDVTSESTDARDGEFPDITKSDNEEAPPTPTPTNTNKGKAKISAGENNIIMIERLYQERLNNLKADNQTHKETITALYTMNANLQSDAVASINGIRDIKTSIVKPFIDMLHGSFEDLDPRKVIQSVDRISTFLDDAKSRTTVTATTTTDDRRTIRIHLGRNGMGNVMAQIRAVEQHEATRAALQQKDLSGCYGNDDRD